MPAALQSAVLGLTGVNTRRCRGTASRPRVAHRFSRRPSAAPKSACPRVSTLSRHCRQASLHLAQQSWKLLKAHVWPIILIFSLYDLTNFVNYRISHRLTNQVAIQLLRVSPADLGPNLWNLTPNPASQIFAAAYPFLVALTLLVALPFTILARSMASSAVAILCCQHPNASARSTSGSNADASATRPTASATVVSQSDAGSASPSENASAETPAGVDSKAAKPHRGVRATVGHMVSTVQLLQPGVAAVWKRAFVVDLLVSVQVLPLQAASMLLVTLPWTLPRLMDLQAANPVAVLDGQEGRKALQESKEVVKPLRAAAALPFLGLKILTVLLKPCQGQVLAALPTRYFRDLPEIPIALYVGFNVLGIVIHRMHDILPVVLYQQGQRHDAIGQSTRVPSTASQ